MTPVEVNLPNQITGNTWEGAAITLTETESGNPIDLSSAVISMAIRRGDETGPTVDTLTTTDGDIVLLDPTNGICTISSYLLTYPVGLYFYDIKFTLQNGDVQTYIYGIWHITETSNY